MSPIKNKKSVLYVFGGEKASGAEIVIERLILNNKAIEPHLFIAPGQFADRLLEENRLQNITVIDTLKKLNRSNSKGVKYLMKAILNYFILSFKVLQYLNRKNIKVIHANTIVPASYLIPAIVVSKLFYRTRKWIWSDHDIKYYSKLDTFLSNCCIYFYTYTLVVSQAVKLKYKKNKTVEVLYNGIDLGLFKMDQGFREQFRRVNQISPTDIIIGIAAGISPRKGQLPLIQAVTEISKNKLNIKLLIAGTFSPDNLEYCDKVRQAIKTSPAIVHLGQVSDMISFYNGCDIIISNSNLAGSEPLGTTIYEAMACEKIVAASLTGGNPEIITNNIDGFLFQADNIEALKLCLDSILSNYADLHEMRMYARQKVEKNFDIEIMTRNYNQILKNI